MTAPDHGASSSPPQTTPGRAHLHRRRWLYGAVATAATLAGGGLAWWENRRSSQAEPEKPAIWNLTFPVPGAAPLKMQTFAGKPLLLNFWATWCPPCVEELPLLDRFFSENNGKGMQVLGLAVDQESAVRAFLQRAPVRFPIAMAGMAGIELSRNLGNLSGGLPFTVVLGGGGEVLHRKMGRISPQDLQAWSLLG